MKNNIVLIGFMGTGKTCIGRILSTRLSKVFIDTDKKIELEAGMSVSEIFRVHGEKYFRDQERLMIAKLARYNNAVISTGGGVVLDPQNITRLRANGIIISLTASVDVILERTSRRNNRPLLNSVNPAEVIAKMLDERKDLYKVADFTIDTSSKSPKQVVNEIINFLRQGGYLRGRNSC